MRFESRTKIVGTDGTDVFEKAKPVLEAALEAMLRRPGSLGPFVVLEDAGTGKFVQWCPTPSSADELRGPRCGSDARALRFEAPGIDLVETNHPHVGVSALRGLDVLTRLCSLPEGLPPLSEGVTVVEEDTFDADVRPKDRRRLSILVREGDGVREYARVDSVERARGVVETLEGDWQVLDLERTLEEQSEWWRENPWTSSETSGADVPGGALDGEP